MFADGGMNVREFVSNCIEEIKKLPNEDKIEKDNVKLLGLWWNVVRDEYTIKLPSFEKERKIMRRKVLAQIAKTFDPLGFCSPAILPAKLFRQEIEKTKKRKWDTELSPGEQSKWLKLMKSWEDVRIVIPRRVHQNEPNEKTKYELHAFSDASILAFGAAIYLRIITGKQITSSLIFGKSLVIPTTMPVRRRTIPNLELHATMLTGKYLDYVKTQLEKEITISKTIIWTDSADVIDMLKTNKRLDRFVKNRVEKIQKWNVNHIEGKMNPADIASRGSTPQELIENKLWWEGPEFLTRKNKWPKTIKEFDPNKREEYNKPQEFEITMNTQDKEKFCVDINRFSKLNRLRNTVAYVLRALGKSKRENVKKDKQEKTLLEKLQQFIQKMEKIKSERIKKREIEELRRENLNEEEKKIIKKKIKIPDKEYEAQEFIVQCKEFVRELREEKLINITRSMRPLETKEVEKAEKLIIA